MGALQLELGCWSTHFTGYKFMIRGRGKLRITSFLNSLFILSSFVKVRKVNEEIPRANLQINLAFNIDASSEHIIKLN